MNLIPLLAAMAVGRYREPGLKVFGNDYPTMYVPSYVPSPSLLATHEWLV